MREVNLITGLTCIVQEGEIQQSVRPALPYMGMKITTPGARYGDDDKQQVLDNNGNPTDVWNSGGNRKMTVSFHSYGRSHEEAYNYMGLLQASLDLQNIQEDLRVSGIAIWIIGSVADLSQLLNTGFEGRAQMDVQFGISMNINSNLGEMDTFNIDGAITTDQNVIENTSSTVTS